jgi:hypothetical protein
MVEERLLITKGKRWLPIIVSCFCALACTYNIRDSGPSARTTPTPFPTFVSAVGQSVSPTRQSPQNTATPSASLSTTPTQRPIQATPMAASTIAPVQPRPVSPEELIPNISWGGWGGGGSRADCGNGIPNVYLSVYGGSIPNPSDVRGYEEGGSVMIGEIVKVHGCDYPAGEQIRATIYLPNSIHEQFLISSSEDVWSLTWVTIPSDPTGLYEIEIQSTSTILREEFLVILPSKPIFTITCSDDERSAHGILTGFVPTEEVLVARYSCCGWDTEEDNLMDYWYVKVRPDGSLIAELPKEESTILAIGRQRRTKIGELLVSAYDFVRCGW